MLSRLDLTFRHIHAARLPKEVERPLYVDTRLCVGTGRLRLLRKGQRRIRFEGRLDAHAARDLDIRPGGTQTWFSFERLSDGLVESQSVGRV